MAEASGMGAIPGIGPYMGMIGGGINAAMSAAGELGRANVASKRLLRNDLKSMESGDANFGGYSEAQRSQMLAAQNRMGQAQGDAMAAQMQRAQAAQPGGQAGGYDTQRGQLLAGRQAATAAFNTGIEQQSSQMAAAKRADVQQRLLAQGAKFSDMAKHQGAIAQSGAGSSAPPTVGQGVDAGTVPVATGVPPVAPKTAVPYK